MQKALHIDIQTPVGKKLKKNYCLQFFQKWLVDTITNQIHFVLKSNLFLIAQFLSLKIPTWFLKSKTILNTVYEKLYLD